MSELTQYETPLNVAKRLGYKIPKKYKKALYRYVKNQCFDLIVGDKENYPQGNSEVEESVTEFCLIYSLIN